MIVQPNQSLLDVILQGCGSMEAGMQFAADNGMAISDMPTIGSAVVISNSAVGLGDAGTITYVNQNGVLFGTKGLPDVGPLITEDGEEPLMSEDGGDVLVGE